MTGNPVKQYGLVPEASLVVVYRVPCPPDTAPGILILLSVDEALFRLYPCFRF